MSEDYSERTREGLDLRQVAEDAPAGDSLVVIYTRQVGLLGKRFLLDDSVLKVGRGKENEVELKDDYVSRRHAHVERRCDGYWVVDEGSANGTYVNEDRIERQVLLRNGDRIKVGQNIFKFLSGEDAEAKYHEEIRRVMIVDGLTQIHNKLYFQEALKLDFLRARKDAHDLCVVMFDIDDFRRTNDQYGHQAGDYVLRELARVVLSCIGEDQVFARFGGEEFVILLPKTSLDGAAKLAEDLRIRVMAHEFTFQGEEVRVTASFGCTQLAAADTGPAELVQRADEELYMAKRSGRNRVWRTDLNNGTPRLRRLRDVARLVAQAQSSEPPMDVVALEIHDEAAVIRFLGSDVFEQWHRDLLNDVDAATDETGIIGAWKGRYVLAAVKESGDLVIERVRDAWTSRPVPEGQAQSVERALRVARLTGEEVRELGERALDELISRLLRRVDLEDTIPGPILPYPLAALPAVVNTRRTSYAQACTIFDAIEAGLKFVVAVELALIRDLDDGGRRRAAEVLVQAGPPGRPLTFGVWQRLSWQLAGHVGVATHPANMALRIFVDGRGRPSELSRALDRVVQTRNAVVHGVKRSEDTYGEEVRAVRKTLQDFTGAMHHLQATTLVSMEHSRFIDDDTGHECEIRVHQGVSDHFPIRRSVREKPLPSGWCCLLDRWGEGEALCLAPVVGALPCERCGRIEVFLAESIVLGPKGADVPMKSITSGHEMIMKVPGIKGLSSVYDAVLGARPERE